MIYEQLFQRAKAETVSAGLIGVGTYGSTLLAQAGHVSRLDVPVICDRDVDVARHACLKAGVSEEDIVLCSSRSQVLGAIEGQKRAVLADCTLMMDTPLDIVVECTGNPEAGAHHAQLAIEHGKHVAMVTKETDAVVGPILKRLADEAGVVYTPVDGDQHGLLIGMVSWMRLLGVDVVCGGKARNAEIVYDHKTQAVTNGIKEVILSEEDMRALRPIQSGEARTLVDTRRTVLKDFPQIIEYDVCEMVNVANATGLMPDTPTLHAPIARISEIPDVLCPEQDGGVLHSHGVIDVVNCLRRADEAGMGGGVFLVIARTDHHGWRFLTEAGLLTNHDGSCGLVYRPYHLLGMETPVSLLCAVLLNIPTGGVVVEPKVDLVARTVNELKAGSTVTPLDADTALEPLLLPSSPVGPGSPLPYHLALGCRLVGDVPAGTTLLSDMIEPPLESQLWALRSLQDRVFHHTD